MEYKEDKDETKVIEFVPEKKPIKPKKNSELSEFIVEQDGFFDIEDLKKNRK